MKKNYSAHLDQRHPLARQRGASLLEGIAYLGIAAIVVLGAVSLLTGAFGSAQSNRTTEEVISIRTAVKKMHSGQAYTTGNFTTTLVSARVLPSTLTVDATTNAVTNAWGGTVTVVGAPPNFTIAYTAVPQDVCINSVSGANGWTRISNAEGANAITTFPVTPTDAATVCTTATNTLEFQSL